MLYYEDSKEEKQMAKKTKFGHLQDTELIVLIKQNQDYLGEVYQRCKQNCTNFMRKVSSNTIEDYELEDIFQDAILVLYEKIVAGNFELTASLQTYLNSVCRFQLLNKYKASQKTIAYESYGKGDSDGDDENENERFNPEITDTLDSVDDPKESQFLAIEKALEVMKNGGGNCYEILTLFWYHKKSMTELTEHFGYTNSDNTKSQKAKCQKRLEKIAYNELNS